MTHHYARCGHEVTPEPGPIKATCGICPPVPHRRIRRLGAVVPPELAERLRAADGPELDALILDTAEDGWTHLALAAVFGVSTHLVNKRVCRGKAARALAQSMAGAS